MFLCDQCSADLNARRTESPDDNEKDGRSDADSGYCFVCLGLRQPGLKSRFLEFLNTHISKAVLPYGGMEANCFSQEHTPPSIGLPGDIVYRYQLAAARLRRKDDRANSSSYMRPPLSPSLFVKKLKHHVRDLLEECISSSAGMRSSDVLRGKNYPDCVKDEEQGFLCVHVLLVPVENLKRPNHVMRPSSASKKRRRHQQQNETKQGGDPKCNLEQRVQNSAVWTMNQALDASPFDLKSMSDEEMIAQHCLSWKDEKALMPFDMHVAIWRRPFYVRGYYTKTRRDVSQTPFFVFDSGARRELSVTSVLDQIVPAVSRHSGGISTLNKDANIADSVVFGMTKFHASGREDMDVRMLIRSPTNGAGHVVTGRPFCCEVVDAFRLPSLRDLRDIADTVNCNGTSQLSPAERESSKPDVKANIQWHGQNPMGVGISNDVSFAPSLSFKNLQTDTESKIKYYGCLCWSMDALSSLEELTKQLGSFPVSIAQRTPLRVLHRRPNMVRSRVVRHCEVVEMIDEHFFRLQLSTDAGTYVKEFVHGDLGRTTPSVSSLLGCKTDILELDCEGIAMDAPP